MTGRFKDDVEDGGHMLHSNYRAMAVANMQRMARSEIPIDVVCTQNLVLSRC